jgi:hypothetical protein
VANRTQTKTGEDSMLELRIRAERWVKKNRLWLIGAVVALIIWLVALGIQALMEHNRIQATSEALVSLQADPTDSAALNTLKERSPQLHNLFLLKSAAQENDTARLEAISSGDDLAADLAAYQLALLGEEPRKLGAYTQREGAPLKELAYLAEALLWHERGDHTKARDALSRISFDSELRQRAEALEHYGVSTE